jgi:tetratricopeptide (TPR) repeat protein/predicted Ser/Thr protein kinase
VALDSEDASIQPARHTAADSVDDGKRPPVRRSLERGRMIGRYVVLYELGSGGMGVVYAAYDPDLDRKVAVKLLHGDTASSRGRQRLMREAKAIAKLTHPNVVTVHDVGQFEGRVFVAMEFIDGVTLRQWLRERPRSWQDTLEVLCAAGDGLAAAHAADLVHRDFKPDNVLVDRSGRVVVLDFGLARRAPSRDDDSMSRSHDGSRSTTKAKRPSLDDAELEQRIEAIAGRSGSFDVDLTRTGALLGTPAYMAPEQHLGNPVDARSDQFSYCVVLWESIFGVRPFRGESATTTAVNVVKGLLQEPPKGNGVPTWLRKVVARGLSVEAGERYPTMGSLLSALRRDAKRRTARRVGVGASIAIAAAAAGGTYVLATREPELCAAGGERLVGAWDDEVRSSVREMFGRTAVTYASTAVSGVEAALDAYAARWVQQHRDACVATHVHHEQSHEMLDARMSCLRDRLSELSALTEEFRRADARVVEHAVEAAADLTRPESCGDVRLLTSRVAAPRDERTQESVEDMRRRLADARAKESAGRYAAARELAQGVLEGALGLAYLPVVAEAHLRLGSALERAGDFAGAERELLEAIWAAETVHHESVAADAWVRLVWVSGVERGDAPLGQRWARFAESAVSRFGGDELLAATLLHNKGGVLYRERRLDEAFDHYDRALGDQIRILGPDDPQVAMTLNHIGNVKIEQDELDAATDYVTRSYELRRRVLGERHPKVAASINNLAAIAQRRGDHDAAIEQAERSLAIVGGTGGFEESISLDIAAQAAAAAGPPGRAAPYLERLLVLRQRSSEREPAALAEVHRRLSADARARGADVEATGHLRSAAVAAADGDPNAAARAYLELAELERALGQATATTESLAEARRHAERAPNRDAALLRAIEAAATSTAPTR